MMIFLELESSAFARNPYAVDSGLGLDTLGETGQAICR